MRRRLERPVLHLKLRHAPLIGANLCNGDSQCHGFGIVVIEIDHEKQRTRPCGEIFAAMVKVEQKARINHTSTSESPG